MDKTSLFIYFGFLGVLIIATGAFFIWAHRQDKRERREAETTAGARLGR